MNTFVLLIEDFLLNLRDNYGFIMPMDRLKRCLSCVSDITDMEEVFFRLQSMTCHNQEQIEIFRSIFAQTFLNIKPHHGNSSSDTSPQNQDSIEQMERNLSKISQRIITYSQQLNQTKSEIATKETSMREAQKELEKIQENIRQLTEQAEQTASVVIPNQEDTSLQSDKDRIKDILNSDSLRPKSQQIMSRIESALRSPDYKELLQKIIDTIMESAGQARSNGDKEVFSSLLSLVSALKKLQNSASKSLSRGAKKIASTSKSALTRQKREEKQAQQKIKEFQSEIKTLTLNQNSLNRTLVTVREKESRISKRIGQVQEQKKSTEQNAQISPVIKPNSKFHRPIFSTGIRSVQTTNEIAELMQTNIKQMSAKEKQKILGYIRANARVFRQTLRKKSASFQHREIDVKATIRKARRTDGEPVAICYKKPKKSHAKIMLLTDISGSCRQASELTLYFMAMMDEAFPGGCQKFVFVNDLVPADQYFKNCGPDEGVQNVLQNVPTRGIYSDYGTTIASLREQFSGSIHKNTTIIILGDARNNSRPSHAKDLKYLADRAHRIFWLETDDPEKWNQGDSIIGTYEQAGAKIYGVNTVGDLLGFLSASASGH